MMIVTQEIVMNEPTPKLGEARKRIKDLEHEVAQLKQQLNDKKHMPATKSLIDSPDFVTDLARYASGVLTESHVRQKYRLTEEDWTAMGEDTALIERIELEKIRRLRSGATKRELAQNHIVKGPEILSKIMLDERSNARHKVDAVKALDALADPGPQRATDGDRVIITIDLGGGHVQTFGKGIDLDDGEMIDVTPVEMIPTREDGGGGNGNAV